MKLLILILLLPLVIAESTLYVYDTNCLPDGSIEFQIKVDEEVSTDKIMVKAIKDEKEFTVPGVFVDEQVVLRKLSDKIVEYASSDNLFKLGGEYFISISGNDIKTKDFRVTCPEFRFACSQISIRIERCYVDGDDAYIGFEGLGIDSLDPYTDIEYQIKIDNSVWMPGSVPKGSEIRKQGNIYTLSFPSPGTDFKSVKLEMPGCDNEDYPSTWSFNSDCFFENRTCVSDIFVGNWSECIEGTMTRIVFDRNECGPIDIATTKPCMTTTCGDGILNGDETGLDCGGSCGICMPENILTEPVLVKGAPEPEEESLIVWLFAAIPLGLVLFLAFRK